MLVGNERLLRLLLRLAWFSSACICGFRWRVHLHFQLSSPLKLHSEANTHVSKIWQQDTQNTTRLPSGLLCKVIGVLWLVPTSPWHVDATTMTIPEGK